ncbi:hypothetical protein Taro_028544 [Colocasia esculenta]|uniref:Uncharacterized protein n=1 Tax=Colocasia esculenta TaxID=4460 RepID=A0A843VS65_COLES|nr:hypothetical protein [Colocasia esculenta]
MDPSPFLPIYVKNIHKSKHGSDSYTYDIRKILKFEEIFSKIFNLSEWQLLYHIAKDEQGLLHRVAVRGVYDGSLFERLEKMGASCSKRA